MSNLEGVFNKNNAIGTTTTQSDGSNNPNVDYSVEHFVPTPLLNTFHGLMRERTFVRSLFRTINMPNTTMRIPVINSGTRVYHQPGEASPGQATGVTSKEYSITARKLMAQSVISREVMEDANQNIQRIVTEDFANALAAAEEQAFLLGRSIETDAYLGNIIQIKGGILLTDKFDNG